MIYLSTLVLIGMNTVCLIWCTHILWNTNYQWIHCLFQKTFFSCFSLLCLFLPFPDSDSVQFIYSIYHALLSNTFFCKAIFFKFISLIYLLFSLISISVKQGRNRMPHLDDIWYVGRARAKGAHGDLDGDQRSSEVKWGKLCAMATIFGQKKPWCKLRMMMTLMEVKGHQRSNGVNYVLWLPYFHIWSKEALIQAENVGDLDGGQRSSEVK